ncbi:MAG: hypothetical protein AB8B55_21380 [Mariniblastus sp.]
MHTTTRKNGSANNGLAIFAKLYRDRSGLILSVELVLLSIVVVIGAIAGLLAIRDAIVSEISDVAGAMQDLNQSFAWTGTNSDGSPAGGAYVDRLDYCDDAGDVAGQADNGVLFDLLPVDEGTELVIPVIPNDPPKVWVQSDTSGIDSFNGRTPTSVNGTIGDGTIDTTFTTTTDTGQITGANNGDIRYSESNANSGTFTTDFADPITNLEFWVEDLTNVSAADAENLLGNFTITLSDGTVLTNAAFTILPDAIRPNSPYGEFTTGSRDRESLVTVTRGGNQYLTDPTINTTNRQGAARITFDAVPTYGGAPPSDAVGVTSISFDRSGGPNNFTSGFSFSGNVLVCE